MNSSVIGMDDIQIGSIGILDTIELTHSTSLRIFLFNFVNPLGGPSIL